MEMTKGKKYHRSCIATCYCELCDRMLGVAGTTVTLDPGPLLALPPATALPVPDFHSHPLARVQAAAVETVRAREHVLDRSYFPRLNLQAAFSGRGTGAQLTAD